MGRELISKATRNDFREVLTGFSLSEFGMIFESADLVPRSKFASRVSGQRRSLVEQYYANVDFCNLSDVRKVMAAFDELMLRLASDPFRFTDHEQMSAKLVARMQRDGFRFEGGRFVCDSLAASLLQTPSLVALTEESISEHVEKARAKIEAGDPAGAITNAYTLVEQFLKELLRQSGTDFKESEGDIRSLYGLVSGPLNLEPKGEHLESYLKTILQGLKSLVAGLYELANKASDRHARRYNPAPHHAKLAVNSALSLCEFLLDSFRYQQERNTRKARA